MARRTRNSALWAKNLTDSIFSIVPPIAPGIVDVMVFTPTGYTNNIAGVALDRTDSFTDLRTDSLGDTRTTHAL